MTTITFILEGIRVVYLDGVITCTDADGVESGPYTMGATAIVGDTSIPLELRKRIHAEIQRGLL